GADQDRRRHPRNHSRRRRDHGAVLARAYHRGGRRHDPAARQRRADPGKARIDEERGKRVISARALGIAGALALFGIPAHAFYPERPVTIVVPFAPGGANDVVVRIIQQPLAAALGQPVIVENRGGAGGNIGFGYVARARPDGYTLLLAPSSF